MTTGPLILCVDDDPAVLATVARHLRRDGHDVLTVDTAAAALAVLAERAVAVLLSDLDMPEMDGITLAARARAVQPETVRILLTGCNTVAAATAGINVGEVYRFLTKPFEADVLRREVQAALAHYRERAAFADVRSALARRQRLLEALEEACPGITAIPRDATGAYQLGAGAGAGERPEVGPGLAAIAALVAERG